MKLTFLGTGTSQGVPVIACDCDVCTSPDPKDKRLRTSAMLEVDGKVIVFDTGPDFRQQMLRERVKRLDAVVFTHPHKDHIAGMDDIRSFNFRTKAPIDVYANALTIEALKREYAYVFATHDKYPGTPSVNLHEIDDKHRFQAAGVDLLPIPVMHHKMPVLGFRAGDLAYVTDANHIAPATKNRLKGLKVLVLNALRRKKHLSHFTLDEAIELVEELRPQHAYFTHISHLMGRHADVMQEVPDNVTIAHDGLSVSI